MQRTVEVQSFSLAHVDSRKTVEVQSLSLVHVDSRKTKMSKRMAEKAGKSERKVKDRFFKT